jgi:hypothetical protein
MRARRNYSLPIPLPMHWQCIAAAFPENCKSVPKRKNSAANINKKYIL